MLSTIALLTTLLFTPVTSHGGCLNYTVGETWYPGYSPYDDPTPQDAAPWMPQRKWTTNEPILSPTNTSLACNAPGDPARAYIPITAGQTITAVYMYWIHTVGPMIAWMARCPHDDCHAAADATALSWFKIGQRGLESGTIETGVWFQGSFSRWDGGPSLWGEKVPEGLEPGRYLVRHEVVSLHSARKPQFYVQCAHLEVSGEGRERPGDEYLTRIPGVWSMEQPEINIDIYAPGVSNSTVYNIPGPPVWKG
ncbi:lytic polysaccharide monooxygenase [Periconia macrospinosa]|uniref:AA9 family lytic polysaccharide monooxygenase n=1 Tax=Periconia macrospinosa TaxID=97972 RepID=A0A2V1ED83_9PLEO|nr:lytic polysaccharide monooxygenase [Periconia macrospinosa]